MSVMMSTVRRLADDEAFGPLVAPSGDKPVLSEQEAAEREAAANFAAVQATADALRSGDAAAPIALIEPSPDLPLLPRVGSLVTFYPRPGEVMRGRKEAAAIVVHRDIAKRTLDLVVIYDANDFRDQERVKERTVEGERGWVQHADQVGAVVTVNRAEVDNSEVRSLIDTMQGVISTMQRQVQDVSDAVFGDFNRPEVSVLEMIDTLSGQVDRLESAKPKRAKRKPARAAKTGKPAAEGAQPPQN